MTVDEAIETIAEASEAEFAEAIEMLEVQLYEERVDTFNELMDDWRESQLELETRRMIDDVAPATSKRMPTLYLGEYGQDIVMTEYNAHYTRAEARPRSHNGVYGLAYCSQYDSDLFIVVTKQDTYMEI